MAQFLNPANFLFRSSTQLVRYYSNSQNFYVLVLIHFPSLVGWLAGVAFFPSSTPTAAFQCSRHFQERLFPRPFLVGQKGLGSRLYTLYVCTDVILCSLVHRPSHSLLFCRFQSDKTKRQRSSLASSSLHLQ